MQSYPIEKHEPQVQIIAIHDHGLRIVPLAPLILPKHMRISTLTNQCHSRL
ncbi:hypothetical protein Hanom_Chr15g01379351 [Helianthus anomalus]